MPSVTYVFDLDGTLCTNTEGKYENAQPIWKRITRVNRMYDQGYTIKISTARGMNTFSDDQNKAREKWYEFTIKQLNDWGVKYHALYVGIKPAANVYVDDKSVSDIEFFGE